MEEEMCSEENIYSPVFANLVISALSGSATTAATRHDSQAPLLVKKAIEIAREAIKELKNA